MNVAVVVLLIKEQMLKGCGIEAEILFCDEGAKKIAANSPKTC
jgi:hypothetical protein